MSNALLDTPEDAYTLATSSAGPAGALPLSPDMLRHAPSGDLFGWTQNVGMGWNPNRLGGKEFLILSTHGGLRADDGTPVALGYHSGHWEVGLLVKAAAEEFGRRGCVPFAGAVTDPCDGRTQGTPGMFDSLPFRNDAAQVLRRLMRSLPTRAGVLGVATCDKGLPAMMMALASQHGHPTVLVPGGVMLAGEPGQEDTGKVQTIGARYAHGDITLEQAAEAGCHACASPGGGCQFLGTAATAQVVGEALGLTLPHAALAPSGQPVWLDMARRSAAALLSLSVRGVTTTHILTDAAFRNALVVFAAFGGSTNLLLHTPAVAFHAGVRRPTADDWAAAVKSVPRLVDALPNGPVGHPTIRVFLAGGVPEVMLHLRELGLLSLDAMTVSGEPLGAVLDWWQSSDRRRRFRDLLRSRHGIDPDDVIMSPAVARRRGLTSALTFPRGNLAPDGSVIKSTSIDPTVVDADGVYRHTGPAKVFTTEKAAIEAIKTGGAGGRRRAGAVRPGADGQRHGGNVSGNECPQVPAVGQAGGGDYRRPVQRRQHRGVRRARFPRGPGRRPGRQAAGRRPGAAGDRPGEPDGQPGPGRRRHRRPRPRLGHGRVGVAGSAAGLGPGPGVTGRHPAVGGVAARQRRRLGRVRVRPGRHRDQTAGPEVAPGRGVGYR